ncbi:MAG: hypothetical protein R3B93_08120 [Bacteroidia bacterium]
MKLFLNDRFYMLTDNFFGFLTAQESSKWEIKDIVNRKSVSQPQFSPTAKMIVWAKRRPSKEKDKFVSDLYLTYLEKTTPEGPKQISTHLLREGLDLIPVFLKIGKRSISFPAAKKAINSGRLYLWWEMLLWWILSPNGISDVHWLNDTTITYISSEGKRFMRRN